MLVPIALLALLWWTIDMPAAIARLAVADARWLVAGLLLVQVQVLVSALRWRVTAARLGQSLDAGLVVREYYVATLLNQVLPGGIAGDAARVFRNDDEVSTARVAHGVVLERLAGQLSLVAFTLVGVLAWPLLLGASPPRAALVTIGSVLLVGFFLMAVVAALGALGPARLARFVAELRPALRRCWFEDGMWLVQGVLSVLVTASYIGVFALCALAIDAPLPLVGVLTVVPLALASMLLPVSVGGWGLREAAAAALWPLVALPADAGVATSVLYGLVSLAGSLPGLAFVIRARRRRE